MPATSSSNDVPYIHLQSRLSHVTLARQSHAQWLRNLKIALVNAISYIDDIIDKAPRLKPPITQGVPREIRTESFQIGKAWVPRHVNVVVPAVLSTRRGPYRWKEPNNVVPERYHERKEEIDTDDAPWLPFRRVLPHRAGKDIAYLTLGIATSATIQNFNTTLALKEHEKNQ